MEPRRHTSITSCVMSKMDVKYWMTRRGRELSALVREMDANAELPFQLIRANSIELLEQLLTEARHVIYNRDLKGFLPIHVAVGEAGVGVIEILLKHGAEIDIQDDRGNLPIHLAAIRGDLDVFIYLLELNVDFDIANETGSTPFELLCKHDHVKLLNELVKVKKIDMTKVDGYGPKALHTCCQYDSIDCFTFLLECQVDLYSTDKLGNLPIHTAIEHSSNRCLQALLARCSTTANNTRRSTGGSRLTCSTKPPRSQRRSWYDRMLPDQPDDLEVRKNSTILDSDLRLSFKAMIEMKDGDGNSVLNLAIQSGNGEWIKICLDHGASITSTNCNRDTPLHTACSRSDLDAVELLLNQSPRRSIVEALAMTNRDGYSPLHIAALFDHVQLINLLVAKQAPLEGRDTKGRTPLLLSASKGSHNACNALIKLEADCGARDDADRNLIHILASSTSFSVNINKTIQLLDQKGWLNELGNQVCACNYHYLHYVAQSDNSEFLEVLSAKCSTSKRPSLLHRTLDGFNPLHLAALNDSRRVMSFLLSNNVRSSDLSRAIYQPSNDGENVLHCAVKRDRLAIVELLIEHGCVFSKCHKGNSPLHMAAENSQKRMCELLLTLSPCLLDQQNRDGQTALHLAAASSGKTENIDFLLSSGAAFLPDKTGTYFVNLALTVDRVDTLRTIINHERWPELWNLLEGTEQCILDGLVRTMPSLFSLVMTRSMTYENDLGSKSVKLIKSLESSELLFHPLFVEYMHEKRRIYGIMSARLRLLYFTSSLALVTSYIVMLTVGRPSRSADSNEITKFYTRVRGIGSAILLLSVVQIIAMFATVKDEGLSYFRRGTNAFEFTMLVVQVTMTSLHLSNVEVPGNELIGVVVLLFNWINYLVQLSQQTKLGIFTAMFLLVLRNAVKCLSVFSLILIAFGFVFFALSKGIAYQPSSSINCTWINEAVGGATNSSQINQPLLRLGNRRRGELSSLLRFTDKIGSDQYGSGIGLLIVKSILMMMGEFEYSDGLLVLMTRLKGGHGERHCTNARSNLLPWFQTLITALLYATFLIFVPLSLMNLLIGLAVGDSKELRTTAAQFMILQHLAWIQTIEAKLPEWFRRRRFNRFVVRKIETQSDLATLQCMQDSNKLNTALTRIEQRLHQRAAHLQLLADHFSK